MINPKLKYRTLKPQIKFEKAQEPFMEVKDGYGYLGVILEDDLDNKVQCHICGNTYLMLATHVRQTHKMTAMEYRGKFSLNRETALQSTTLSEKQSIGAEFRYKLNHGSLNYKEIRKYAQSQAKKFRKSKEYKSYKKRMGNTIETMNKYGSCPLQVEERFIKIVDELGRAPTYIEMIEKDHSLLGILCKRYKGYTNALIYFGLKNKKYRGHSKWGTDELQLFIRRFVRENKRLPNARDTKVGALPDYTTIVKYFGSWYKAKEYAFNYLKTIDQDACGAYDPKSYKRIRINWGWGIN